MSAHPYIRFFTFGLALLMVSLFAACADEPDIEEPVVDEPMLEEPMDDDMATADVTVDGTISALEGGIMNLAPAAAVDNINGWIATLENASFDGAEDIADSLEELREELTDDEIDGEYVGEILMELGEDTAAVAGTNAGLSRLASLLTAAGGRLNAADDM